jgi:hypothetical protein
LEILERTSTNRVTLRLQNDILEVLKREAFKKDLTLNAFINKILNKDVTYEENVNAILNVVFPHDLFLLIMEKLKESDIKELAEQGPRIVKKLFNIIGMQYDIEHVIHSYFVVLGKYCNWFEFSFKVSGSKYRLVFSTNSTQKWIQFLQLYIKSILESMKIIITNESQHDGILVFEFSYKNYN